jgi:type I restriction enzyme S subunit
MDSGSAIPSTSREDFYNLRVLSPPFKVQQAFAELLNPCWAQQEHNNRESSTLTALRNTLLPKLISGELRVKDAEKMVGRVADALCGVARSWTRSGIVDGAEDR